MHHVMLDDVSANVTGSSVTRTQKIRPAREYGAFQVSYADAATGNVKLQGRLSTSMEWEDIVTQTVDGIDRVTIMPLMRATLDTYGGSGNIRAELDY